MDRLWKNIESAESRKSQTMWPVLVNTTGSSISTGKPDSRFWEMNKTRLTAQLNNRELHTADLGQTKEHMLDRGTVRDVETCTEETGQPPPPRQLKTPEL